ncbi:MAG: hypothetical protein ABI760_10700 [Ferruginibacter sp.]
MHPRQVNAQDLNIKGDTIFVNAEGEFVIFFPSKPRNFSTLPVDAPYDLNPLKDGVSIRAKSENTSPATLKISESDRNHRFIIVFKKDIDFNDNAATVYDYRTEKKLEQHIRATASNRLQEPSKAVVSNEATKVPTNQNDNHPVEKPAGTDRSAQKENDKKYISLTTDAKVYLDQKKYEQARDAFRQALEIRPGDSYASRQLETINKILLQINEQKQQQETVDAYNKYIAQGDKALSNDQLTEARTAYEQALVNKPNDIPATNRLKLIDKKEKEQKQREELEKNYNTAMQSAARFFDAGDYINAKMEYNKAMGFLPGPKPQEEIKKINDLIANQAVQKNAEKQRQELEGKIVSRYTTIIKNAETEFDKSNYAQAKKLYKEASDLRPTEEYPKERLLTIENILAKIDSDNKAKKDSVALANVEKRRLAEEAEITGRYTALIKNAGIEFDKSNYVKAKKLYTDASVLKPGDEYSKERLLTIENITAKNALEKETNRKYDLALLTAKSNHQKNDFLNAKLFYEEATALKPLEEEPKNQLRVINDRLAAIAKEKEINNKYNLKIAVADSQRNANELEGAIISYNEALSLKPLELYPKSQINNIQSTRNSAAIKKGDKATADKRWNDAISAYAEALNIHPNNEYAQQRLKIVTYQGEKARTDSLDLAALNKEPLEPEKTKKQKRKKRSETEDNKIVKKEDVKPIEKNLESQNTPITYSNEELKTKYPEFDFSVLPPDQPFNQTAVYNKNKESLQIYGAMVQEKPRLDLDYSDQKIKLICEAINFQESNAYFKMRIQNYSNTDFLTGAMMITWTKKAGNHIKLYPNHLYPSPLPVIKPGHEAFVIYSCKTYEIANEEILDFELIDRPKKVTLQLKIPGTVFNKELARQ